MTDPNDRSAPTGRFGARDGEPGGYSTEAPGDTSQDQRPIKPAAVGADEGTAYKPATLDRPQPGDEPLKVRFEKEG